MDASAHVEKPTPAAAVSLTCVNKGLLHQRPVLTGQEFKLSRLGTWEKFL